MMIVREFDDENRKCRSITYVPKHFSSHLPNPGNWCRLLEMMSAKGKRPSVLSWRAFATMSRSAIPVTTKAPASTRTSRSSSEAK